MRHDTQRRCNGGPDGPWCGNVATVVCTAPDGTAQWYACEDEAHRAGAYVEPLSSWWSRVLGPTASGL